MWPQNQKWKKGHKKSQNNGNPEGLTTVNKNGKPLGMPTSAWEDSKKQTKVKLPSYNRKAPDTVRKTANTKDWMDYYTKTQGESNLKSESDIDDNTVQVSHNSSNNTSADGVNKGGNDNMASEFKDQYRKGNTTYKATGKDNTYTDGKGNTYTAFKNEEGKTILKKHVKASDGSGREFTPNANGTYTGTTKSGKTTTYVKENGKMIQAERKSSDGNTTYKYSGDGKYKAIDQNGNTVKDSKGNEKTYAYNDGKMKRTEYTSTDGKTKFTYNSDGTYTGTDENGDTYTAVKTQKDGKTAFARETGKEHDLVTGKVDQFGRDTTQKVGTYHKNADDTVTVTIDGTEVTIAEGKSETINGLEVGLFKDENGQLRFKFQGDKIDTQTDVLIDQKNDRYSLDGGKTWHRDYYADTHEASYGQITNANGEVVGYRLVGNNVETSGFNGDVYLYDSTTGSRTKIGNAINMGASYYDKESPVLKPWSQDQHLAVTGDALQDANGDILDAGSIN